MMDIEKHPLKPLSDLNLLDRLGEECAEVVHAIFKLHRFGDAPSPRSGLRAIDMIMNEINDLKTVLEEVECRDLTERYFNGTV